MIAGTLAQFVRPLDEPLSDWARNGSMSFPAIDVSLTQETHGESTPQSGTVAGRVDATDRQVYVETDDDVSITTETTDGIQTIATDWYADVTDSGVVLAESIAEPTERPFPFDVFAGVADQRIERKQLDVEEMYGDWKNGRGLSNVWMRGTEAVRGTRISYHGDAKNTDSPPTIGLGFERSWNGTTLKGVAYASGYVALYDARHPADGLQFVSDEILPYAERWDPEEHEDQTDFDDFGGGA